MFCPGTAVGSQSSRRATLKEIVTVTLLRVSEIQESQRIVTDNCVIIYMNNHSLITVIRGAN